VTRKLWSFALVLGLLAAACSSGGQTSRTVPIPQFVPQVVEFLDDAGRSPSIAVDSNGDPTLAYLGLPEKLAKGEIPPARPLTLPMIPAILTSSLTNGIWNHGAIVATENSSKPIDLRPTDEVAIAIDSGGTEHAAFTLKGALHYATATSGGPFGKPKTIATGKFGGLSIAADSGGTPWVSYYRGSEVDVATLSGKTWTIQKVASGVTTSSLPERTSIQAGAAGPVVAFTDGRAPMLATQKGGGWTVQTLAGTGGFGISLALDSKGNPNVAYYTASGDVQEIAGGGSPVTVARGQKVSGSLNAGWSAAVGIDSKGTTYVAWYDPTADETRFASNSGSGFKEISVTGTDSGQLPVLAVSPDGSQVFVAWYDHVNLDLHMGTYFVNGAPKGLTLAKPSPQAAPTTAAPSGCSPSGTTVKVVAKGIAFDTNCLAAPAKQAFTIDFDNQDAGIPHNVEVYTNSSATQRLAGAAGPTDTITGVTTTTYKVSPLPPGTYYFQCDVHPTQMFGTFIVK
jgi:plastocyanin